MTEGIAKGHFMKRALVIGLLLLAIIVIACVYLLWTPDEDRQSLEARYMHPPSRYLSVAGIQLRICDTGPRGAPAILLLHGFGSSLETWDAWAKSLTGQFRVIRLDLPGAGLTGPDPTGDYSDARSVQIILALMERLGVARAAFIGNSIGGRIAWRFAALEPTHVSKLVLISPDGFPSPGFAIGQKPDVPYTARLMQFVLPKFLLRANLEPAYADPVHLSDNVVTRYYDLILAPGVRSAMLARMAGTVLDDPGPLLKRVQAPTLLLWGEKDALIPFSNATDYLKDIPHSILVPLPGLGHVPQEEAPSVSLEPVVQFLRR